MLTSRKLWIGLAVTAVFLGILAFRVDLHEIRHALAQANYWLLLPAILAYFCSLYVRSYRWQFLLLPFTRVKVTRLYPVILVGYTANNLLPVRLGEIVRSYFLSRREPIRAATALGTIIVERVFDGAFLLITVALVSIAMPMPGFLIELSDTSRIPQWLLASIVLGSFAGVGGIVVYIAVDPNAFHRLAERITSKLPSRFGKTILALAIQLADGFIGLSSLKRVGGLFLLTAPIWIIEAIMYFLIALGFGIDTQLPSFWHLIGAISLVTAISNLATSIPSSQGSVGPFELFTVLSLEFLGVGTGVATAYAIVLHMALLIPVIAAGLGYLAIKSINLSQLASSESCPENNR